MTNEEAIKVLRFVLDPREYPNGEKSKCYQYNLGAINKAIEAFKKQIPKKPENHSGRYTDNLCPLCGKRIKSGQGSSSRERTNWCNHCGQAIDWGDDE